MQYIKHPSVYIVSTHQQYEDWLDIVQKGFWALQTRPLAVNNSLTLLVSLLETMRS